MTKEIEKNKTDSVYLKKENTLYEKKPPNFYLALINARRTITKIVKNKKGFNYDYADLPAVLDEVIEPLSDNDIFMQCITSIDNQELLEIRLTYAHTGETISTYVPLLGIFAPKDASSKLTLMQNMGSTITYAMRYGILSILSLCPAKDTDAADTSNTHSKKPSMPPPLAPSTKGMPFSKSLPPIAPKVVNESNDELMQEITHLWSLKKEICQTKDPLKADKINKYIDDQFMGVPKENLMLMRTYLRDLREAVKESVSLDDTMEDLIA